MVGGQRKREGEGGRERDWIVVSSSVSYFCYEHPTYVHFEAFIAMNPIFKFGSL